MKRITHIIVLATTLLATGMVAFAIAAGTAPPRVDRIPTVVTDRPVREVVVTPPADVKTAVAATPKAQEKQPPRPVRTVVSPFTSAARDVQKDSATDVTSSKKPLDPRTDKPSGSDSDDVGDDEDDENHEVVKPGVRDSDEAEESDGDRNTRSRNSRDRSRDEKKPAYHKGD